MSQTATEEEKSGSRGRIWVETGTKRIRAFLGGIAVADTSSPLLVWEKPYYPAYYFPVADVRTELLEPDHGVVHSPSRGDARPFTVRAGDLEVPKRRDPLLRLAPARAPRHDPLRVGRDRVLVRGGRGGLHPPPRPLHPCRHRAELPPRADRGRRRHGGRVDEPAPPFETGLRSATTYQRPMCAWTSCGRPTRSATAPTRATPNGGRPDRRQDPPRPRLVLPDAAAESQKIAGLVAFYDEKVDVYVDGVLQERPRTKFS